MNKATAPLKVAQMIETRGPGGAEVVMLNLADELRNRGHQVYPIGPAPGWLSEKFESRGFEHQPFSVRRRAFSLRRLLDWTALSGLVRLLRELEIDVVHSHEFTMSVYGAAAARMAGAAHVITMHGGRPARVVGADHVITMHGSRTMTSALRRRIALRWAFRNSYATTAVSNATKVQLEHELGLGPASLAVIRNGVPIPHGSPLPVRHELGLRGDDILILAVGSLDPGKGHIVLLQALRQLVEQGLERSWALVIAAGRGGPEQPRLEAFAADHGLREKLHILKYRNDIPNLLAAADMLVMPSLWEGLPLAVLEAMLAGIPVIGSEVGGIPEAIVSGVHGLLTPSGDVPALATALGSLLSDRAYRLRLARQGQERALTEFTVGTMADAYERLYCAALG